MHKEKQDIPSIYKSLSIKSILIWVKDKESVEILKTKVQQRVGLPIAEQKLISEGKMLRDKRTLKDYKISRGSSLSLISGLRGGTTPGPSFSYKEPARIGAGQTKATWATRKDTKISNNSLIGQPRKSVLFHWKHPRIEKRETSEK